MNGEVFFPPRRFAAVPPRFAEFDSAGVVVLPIPYDSTTDWRGGKREAPQAIIDASQYMELYDIELEREIHRVGIHTLPELQPVLGDPREMTERVAAVVSSLVETGKLVVVLGGEHTLTLGAVTAYRRRFPALSVLQLDAHADLRDHYLGGRYSHATVMRRVREICPVLPVGIRSLSAEEARFIREQGVRSFYAQGWNSARIEEVVAALSPQVYISIDLDVLDPAVMAAVGTPEPGGLGWEQVLEVLRAVARGREVVGFDVVELSPRDGPVACAFLAAKLVYKLIGYVTQGKGE